jgi:ABC-type glycerol-3-phosphate transport system substrate-binding protein
MTLKSIGRTMTRRTVWLVMVLALVLTLALSACGGRGGLGGNRGGSSGSNSGDQGSQSTNVTQVTQADDDLNAIMSALDGANQDMSIDESGQDSEILP